MIFLPAGSSLAKVRLIHMEDGLTATYVPVHLHVPYPTPCIVGEPGPSGRRYTGHQQALDEDPRYQRHSATGWSSFQPLAGQNSKPFTGRTKVERRSWDVQQGRGRDARTVGSGAEETAQSGR